MPERNQERVAIGTLEHHRPIAVRKQRSDVPLAPPRRCCGLQIERALGVGRRVEVSEIERRHRLGAANAADQEPERHPDSEPWTLHGGGQTSVPWSLARKKNAFVTASRLGSTKPPGG